jgi:hypothetical protein
MILEHFSTSLSWMSDVTVAMALSMHSWDIVTTKILSKVQIGISIIATSLLTSCSFLRGYHHPQHSRSGLGMLKSEFRTFFEYSSTAHCTLHIAHCTLHIARALMVVLWQLHHIRVFCCIISVWVGWTLSYPYSQWRMLYTRHWLGNHCASLSRWLLRHSVFQFRNIT